MPGERLLSFLQIRTGEGRLAALVVGLFLLPSVGGAIGSPGVEALFFARFGVEFLPTMYMALSAVTILASLLITALLGRVAKKRLYLALPLVLVALLVLARFLVSLDLNWFYPVLWLGMYLMWTLQGLFTWGLAGMVCDTRQAKRLFPLFGAGGILGIALGGLATQPLVRLAGTENLLLAWAITLAGSFFLVRLLTADVADPIHVPSHRGRPGVADDLKLGLLTVRRSPLLRRLALSAVLFAVLLFSLGFPFSKAVAAQFPDEDSMAGFLGIFNGLTTALAFVISLLAANRLYARLGFMAAVLVLPIIYLVGFSAMAVYATFLALVAFRFLQMAWLLGVSSTAYQAVFSIVPADRREQTRAFVDGILGQIGVFAIGLILAAGSQTLQPQHLFLIGAGAAAAATIVVWRAHGAYSNALTQALRDGRPQLFYSEEQPFGGFPQDAAAVAIAVSSASDPEPAVRRLALQILGRLAAPGAADTFVDALADHDPEVRAAALQGLAMAGAAPALLEVVACLEDPEPVVRLAAVTALTQLTPYWRGVLARVEPLLADPDLEVQAQVAIELLRHSPAHPQALAKMEAMVRSDSEEQRLAAQQALRQWGDSAAYSLAATGLADSRPGVRRAAAHALATIDAERCIQPLVEALADEDPLVRSAIAEALGSVGARAVAPAAAALADPRLEAGALEALGRLPARQVAPSIRAYAQAQVEQAQDYHELWQTSLAACGHGISTSILPDSLREMTFRKAHRALRAAGLLGSQEVMALVIENLDRDDPGQRANALEMLETATERGLLQPMLAIWEAPLAGATRPPPVSHDWLLRLLDEPDEWLRACAAHAARRVDNVHVQARLAQLADTDSSQLVRETAAGASREEPGREGDTAVDTLPTMGIMERILLLQRVPIFAGLSPAELKQLAAIAGEHLFADGEVFVRQGDLGDEMYVIASGQVRVIANLDEAREVELAVREAGDHVGEMAILSREARLASLIAVGSVRALCIEQDRFETLLRERPDVGLAIMRVLIQRLKEERAERLDRAES